MRAATIGVACLGASSNDSKTDAGRTTERAVCPQPTLLRAALGVGRGLGKVLGLRVRYPKFLFSRPKVGRCKLCALAYKLQVPGSMKHVAAGAGWQDDWLAALVLPPKIQNPWDAASVPDLASSPISDLQCPDSALIPPLSAASLSRQFLKTHDRY